MEDGIEAGDVLDFGKLIEANLQYSYRRSIVSVTTDCQSPEPRVEASVSQLTKVPGLLALQFCGKCAC